VAQFDRLLSIGHNTYPRRTIHKRVQSFWQQVVQSLYHESQSVLIYIRSNCVKSSARKKTRLMQ